MEYKTKGHNKHNSLWVLRSLSHTFSMVDLQAESITSLDFDQLIKNKDRQIIFQYKKDQISLSIYSLELFFFFFLC